MKERWRKRKRQSERERKKERKKITDVVGKRECMSERARNIYIEREREREQ